MRRITPIDRLLLLLTAILAAYQVVIGIEGMSALPTWAFTIAFGVLLVACLLLIILGFEALESPSVVVISSLLPLGLSLGLIAEYVPSLVSAYLIFAIAGYAALLITRYRANPLTATLTLIIAHGVSGLVIFMLPIVLVAQGSAEAGFLLVSLAGAFIGIGGMLFAFWKSGRPILTAARIFTILPWLLLSTCALLIAGLG
jgi:hypothetical protein